MYTHICTVNLMITFGFPTSIGRWGTTHDLHIGVQTCTYTYMSVVSPRHIGSHRLMSNHITLSDMV